MVERNPKTTCAVQQSSVTLVDKVCFLSLPENLHDCAKSTQVLQTHHSWLFITARHALKLKKPISDDRIDYRTLERRRWACQEELRLNRRLAPRTYRQVIPLYVTDSGELSLVQTGTVVDWLVKMEKLPDDRMLDVLVTTGTLANGELERVMQRLSDFYRLAVAIDIPETSYCERLRTRVKYIGSELQVTQLPCAQRAEREITPILLEYVDLHSEMIENRFSSGYVRELHGDLRPEHICVDSEIEIFDCLEFDVDLRTLDCLEEIAFLGFECARLGAPWLEHDIRTRYSQLMPDKTYRDDLADFYAAKQALGRALLYARRAVAMPPDEHCRKASEHLCQFAEHYCTSLEMAAHDD